MRLNFTIAVLVHIMKQQLKTTHCVRTIGSIVIWLVNIIIVNLVCYIIWLVPFKVMLLMGVMLFLRYITVCMLNMRPLYVQILNQDYKLFKVCIKKHTFKIIQES